MKTASKKANSLIVALSILLLVGLVIPLVVFADESVKFDTSLMKTTDDPSTYTGGKDAVFAVDGDVLKLTYKVGINRTTKEFTYTPVTGFSNQTAMDWFGNGVTIPLKTKDNTTVKFNGTELSSDTSADSYFNITYKTEYVAPNMVVTYNLEIKPGVEIGSDFFSKNQVQIISQSNNETVIIGKYDGSVEPDPLKPAKTITPAEDYRVPTESNQVNNLQLRVNSDSDQNWAGKLTKVTYSFDGGEPVEMVLGKAVSKE